MIFESFVFLYSFLNMFIKCVFFAIHLVIYLIRRDSKWCISHTNSTGHASQVDCIKYQLVVLATNVCSTHVSERELCELIEALAFESILVIVTINIHGGKHKERDKAKQFEQIGDNVKIWVNSKAQKQHWFFLNSLVWTWYLDSHLCHHRNSQLICKSLFGRFASFTAWENMRTLHSLPQWVHIINVHPALINLLSRKNRWFPFFIFLSMGLCLGIIYERLHNVLLFFWQLHILIVKIKL